MTESMSLSIFLMLLSSTFDNVANCLKDSMVLSFWSLGSCQTSMMELFCETN